MAPKTAPQRIIGRTRAGSSESSNRPDVELLPNASPVQRFIAEEVWPAWDELRDVPKISSTQRMMYNALKRRSIRVRKVDESRKTFLYNGEVIGGMQGLRSTTLVSAQARDVCASKLLTKRYLTAAGIPTPRGKSFAEDEFPEAEIFAATLARPAAVKPDSAGAGRGISLRLQHNSELPAAWNRALENRSEQEGATGRVLIEEHVTGLDLRAVVVGVHVVAAAVRVPLFVVGDGEKSVEELLKDSTAHRKRHQLLHRRGVAYDDEQLRRAGTGRTAVPQRGELLILSATANLHAGGIPVDVTDAIPEELKELAVNAAWSVPGLRASAVDIILPSLHSTEGAEVIEVEDSPDPMPHVYPAFGKLRRVASAMANEILLEGED